MNTLIRSLATILVVASSFVLVTGQTTDTDKTTKTTNATQSEKLRDISLSGGVNLQFLIEALAKDMDLNVSFDAESRLESRTVRIVLKGVTVAEALELVLLQERLYSEEAGPRTIMVTSRLRGSSIVRIGVGITPLTEQRAQFFGVEAGILINNVLPDSPASKAGLKVGDVIVKIDGQPVRSAVGVMRAIDNKEGDLILRVVRDRKDQTVTISIQNTSP